MRARSSLVVSALLLTTAGSVGVVAAQEQERRRPIVWPAELQAIIGRHVQDEIARLTGEVSDRSSVLRSSAAALSDDAGQLARALMRVRIPTVAGRPGGAGSVASPSVPSGGGGGSFGGAGFSIGAATFEASVPPPPRP
jgi:hypothetical protein